MFLKIKLILFFILALTTCTLHGEGQNGYNERFINEKLMNNIFSKLDTLLQTKSGQINIIHIGDSHIQAGFISNVVRNTLQNAFGNAGYGFSFPYNLVKTNGPRSIKYTSNIVWDSKTNTRPLSDVGIGLGGMSIYTSDKNFVIQIESDYHNRFNSIKIFYPTTKPQFRMSVNAEPLKVTETATRNYIKHRVRPGQTLSAISRKYGVSIIQIKKLNNLRTNNINAGAVLQIPYNDIEKYNNLISNNIQFVKLDYSNPYFSTYQSDTLLNRVSLFASVEKYERYTFNGCVLENGNPGIIYHSIGVNGAHLSDYNKYPLFFKQLSATEPDLIIISLGTNESFGHLSPGQYLDKIQRFITNVKAYVQNVTIIVTTPPPSMFRGNKENTVIEAYSQWLTNQKKYTVWDLYNRLGGNQQILNGQLLPFMAKDKIHYTQQAYENQGNMFANDFLYAYKNYIASLKK